MESIRNNRVFWVLIVVTIFNIGIFLLGKVVVDKAADRVIQKLQQDYSPSPYGPGLDPDKVAPDALKSQKQYLESRKKAASKVFVDETLREGDVGRVPVLAGEADHWRAEWEKSRGVTP